MAAIALTIGGAYYMKQALIPPTIKGKVILFVRAFWGAPLYICFKYSSMTLPTQIFVVLLNMNIIYSVLMEPFRTGEMPTSRSVSMVIFSFFGVVLLTFPEWFGLGVAHKIGKVHLFGIVTVTLCAIGNALMSIFYAKYSKIHSFRFFEFFFYGIFYFVARLIQDISELFSFSTVFFCWF